ncbi:sodium-translocating pyrophosphatase [Candidatus Saccharibacteria bacterium]|nr:sodium-translocating pyrophosphatase [Candidatus Saccharibacteria bacterium]
MVHIIALIVISLAVIFMSLNYHSLKKLGEGDTTMISIAKIIRDGANTFMLAEYKTILVVVLIVAVALALLIEKSSGITFILGACMSSMACLLGMRSATYANVRTTNQARKTRSIGDTVKVALMGGSVSGLSVQAFGLLGLVLITIFAGEINAGDTGSGFIPVLRTNPAIMRLTAYSLGCSLVAMFNRVAGGNYTKAADISADIVAKVRHSMPEDDSRMPNTIADFIGDNVNDIAGNCSDLLESFVATIVASILIAMSISGKNESLFQAAIAYPIILASGGLFGCIIGLFFVLKHKPSKDPSRELNLATYISAAVVLAVGCAAAYWVFHDMAPHKDFILGWASPWISSILGIASGVAIGKITEVYTSTKFKSVQSIAKIAVEGDAFVVTKGDAVGSKSCLLPILVIGISLFASGKLCGVYGIAIAALGMLSFVATTVSIDAFGPIADNAGGIAESCRLGPDIRAITDKLDAVGNTTAAIGKGFAIGSAAFATVSLIFAYVGSYSNAVEPVLNIASFTVIAGGIIGGALVEFFSALLTDNTIESAYLMAEEGDRQLSMPGVLEGYVKPDYNKCIKMATEQALKKMLIPSVLALFIPVIGGILFGPQFVGGILIGATIVAIPRAIFMGNSGGAFDNAKKLVESGFLKGHVKGSPAHKATVVGDTVGDTRKDVVGVALDIFIKTMSTVANTLAPVFASFHIF